MESKARPSVRVTTLEAHHQHKMKEFGDIKNSLASYEAEMAVLENKLDTIPPCIAMNGGK
jgi:hypothetical protein